MVYTKCKICGSDVIDFLSQFELLKCVSCGIIFYKHALKDTETLDLYDKLYNEQQDYSHFKKQAAELKKGVQPHLGYNKQKVLRYLLAKNCKRIVEIGAGVGITGNYLQKKGVEYSGIELDKEAAKLANDAGINIKNSSFESLSDHENTDAVIAFEVLEHIDNIKLCFELIRNSIKANGYIGFTVPNFNNYYNQSAEQQQHLLGQTEPPVHINFFTTASLEKILSLFRFSPVYLRARPYPTLLWRKKRTYKKLWESVRGIYHGSTIICIAQKVD